MTSKKRDLIHDTQASSLTGEGVVMDEERANSMYITTRDFRRLGLAFRALRDELPLQRVAQGFRFNGSQYTYIKERCRITLNQVGQDINYVKAELTFTREGDSTQKWISVTYTLYTHHNVGPVLAFIGNPTTVVSGNNIRPIRIDDVSRFQETLYFYRLGFLLLLDILDEHAFTWDKKTAKDLQQGKVNVSNTQWALYLPTQDKKIDMVLLAGLYCGRSIKRESSMSLAEYLGFESAMVMKGDAGNLSGVFLTKKKGTNHVLTINFYDKRQSVNNKKQGKTLSAEEIKLVDNSMRLDITAHVPFLQVIINAAKKHAEQLIKVQPALRQKLSRFCLSTDKRISAYMICRAMSILAVQIKDGELYKGSFTTWLLQRVLEDELHLISILKYGSTYLHTETRDADHNAVLKIWRKQVFAKSTDFVAAVLREFKGRSQRWVYTQRKEIMQQYGLDVFVPYDYWLELSNLNQAYGLTRIEQEKLYEARFNPDLSPAVAGRTLQKLNQRSNKAFNKSTRQLLHSLQLVARQVNAEKLDVRMLKSI